jgi:hypothetical protein
VFQLGVILLLNPALASVLQRKRLWKVVVAANTVIMTVFLWHMTALLAALTLFETARLPIYPEPTAAWWTQRPLWLLVPGALLAALVALFARAETPRRRAQLRKRRASPAGRATSTPAEPPAPT